MNVNNYFRSNRCGLLEILALGIINRARILALGTITRAEVNAVNARKERAENANFVAKHHLGIILLVNQFVIRSQCSNELVFFFFVVDVVVENGGW